MRFALGKIPDNLDFKPEEQGWRSIREPPVWLVQILAVPSALALALLLGLAWKQVHIVGGSRPPLIGMLALLLPIFAVHELAHVALHPGCGSRRETIVGLWPSRLMFYAHYDGMLTRGRFVTILLAPFCLLSLLPLAIALVIGYAPFMIFFVTFLNGIGCCADVLGVFVILSLVPRGALTRNKSWRTYYRDDSGGGLG